MWGEQAMMEWRPPAPEYTRIAVLGAGPVGLDAALAAADAGLPFTVIDSEPHVGGNVRRWGHVRLFTPWAMNVSERMARHLADAGRRPPDDGDLFPTGEELVTRLLEPLASLPEIGRDIVLGTRVLGIGRSGLLKHEEIGTPEREARPFRILVERPDGGLAVEYASVVLDCTGSYGTANATGDGGIPAPGEEELDHRIQRTMPDLAREGRAWAGRSILLVGSGKSAQTAARDLASMLSSAPDTRVVWAVRRTRPDWGEIPDDPIPERQALVLSSQSIAAGRISGIRVERGATVDSLRLEDGQVVVRLGGATDRDIRVDRVLSLTGYVPDASLYRQLQVHECYATAAPMNLAAQLLGAGENCLELPAQGIDVLRTPEPDFFVLGAKSYGRLSNFLLRTGYDQVSTVFGAGFRGYAGMPSAEDTAECSASTSRLDLAANQ
jgi:NAD(P)-binding Rossmann-like domain